MPLGSEQRRAAGGNHVGISSAYIQLSVRERLSAVLREASASADSSESEDREATEAWRLCHGVEPAEECEDMELSERRRKMPDADMRLLAGWRWSPCLTEEADATVSATLGKLELRLRGVRGARVAP